ncbi:fibronectin type III domain-containing protein [Paenibacillus qinlingensis]|uniref:golvesin C-terminal-like domain-containing protein n=1 Tax=Paenibacillus qinlingensis TaxID=1837343 RepID=UPI0015657B03|nr:fibronectin type III domain-containing protein [Paenibacillus qinlingensis]NQX64032.1 right-handed parallel beta-helix repeat-containing protein [Paenibacillus qinlingensis]
MKLKGIVGRAFTIMMSAAVLMTAWIAVAPGEHAYADNTAYYVDAVNGNDSNNGTSTTTAWRTLSKVNAKTNYLPGDQILFKSGTSYTGSLKLRNSGASGNPIIVGKFGGDIKPIINANAAYAAIELENIQYFTLQDLEITNYKAADPDDYLTGFYRRNGIWIKAFHNGPMRGITIRNMDIHDVTGMNLTGETTTTTTDGKDKGVNKNSNAGIQIDGWEWEPTQPKAYYDGLTIENNYIHDLVTIGINMAGHSSDTTYFNRNVTIRGNSIMNNGADGIIIGVTNNPLIENNVTLDVGAYAPGIKWIAGIWVWRTNQSLVQFNEVGRVNAEIKNDSDSTAFDTDIQAQGDQIFQYNYSHENEGGFFMDMNQLKNGRNILRYNISQNDKRNGWHSFTINSADPSIFYNNVFYNSLGIGFQMKNSANATFINNIFYVTGSTETYAALPRFINNAFYGQTAPAQGLSNIVGNPGFVNPGAGGDGMTTVDGYKLNASSPLIGAGRVVANHGVRDFWNNPIYTGLPDIGAFEHPTSTITDTVAPSAPTAVTVTGKSDTTVSLSWTSVESSVPLDADIYNAANNQVLTSVIAANTATVTGLTPGTAYSFYIKAKDRNWNASVASATVSATTMVAVTVDNTQAVRTGSWTAATGGNAYNNDYHRIAAGSGSSTVKWTPTIPTTGYYTVYYFLPDGTTSRAGNASYTVSGAGGSKAYSVDQRVKGGSWVPLGIHRFSQGTTGYVQLNDTGNGEVAADAVKFVYESTFGLDDIVSVQLTTKKLQMRLGETTTYTVTGVDNLGKLVDLVADGAALTYTVDNPSIAGLSSGIITGNANGATQFRANFTFGGNTLVSNSADVIVGPRLTVDVPTFTNASGQTITSISANSAITASSRVINSSEKQISATLILALYSPTGLVSYTIQEAVVNKYDNKTFTATLTTPASVSGYYIKGYMWDNTNDTAALAEEATLQ